MTIGIFGEKGGIVEAKKRKEIIKEITQKKKSKIKIVIAIVKFIGAGTGQSVRNKYGARVKR